jgi:hypothetical protein
MDAMLVMEYGGWENFSTFRESYLNIHDPAYQRQEREKIEWLCRVCLMGDCHADAIDAAACEVRQYRVST